MKLLIGQCVCNMGTISEPKLSLHFLQALYRQIDPAVTVDSFQEAPGSVRGDNYTAILYRIKINGFTTKFLNDEKTQQLWSQSIIYKCLPDNSVHREAFKSEILFRNEVAFYTRVIPLFQKFQESKRHSISKFFQAVPKCYLAENDTIILEDLCEQGYCMADRKLGLNYEQMVSVLSELAQFHAISLALKISNPEEFYSLIGDKYGIHEGLFLKEHEEWYRGYYKQAIQNAVEMVSSELNKHVNRDRYLTKFRNFVEDNFFAKMVHLVSYTEPLSVFCHGDCWTNNILFKQTDNSELQKVCFIDFQLCRYGSLALDLVNLIYCCTTRKLRDSSLPVLLQKYHSVLHKSMVDLLQNSKHANHELVNKTYLFDLLKAEFKRCSLFGLGLAIDMIPISTCDSEDAPDMYEEEDKTLAFVPLSYNEECKTKMTNLVCEFVDNGLL